VKIDWSAADLAMAEMSSRVGCPYFFAKKMPHDRNPFTGPNTVHPVSLDFALLDSSLGSILTCWA